MSDSRKPDEKMKNNHGTPTKPSNSGVEELIKAFNQHTEDHPFDSMLRDDSLQLALKWAYGWLCRNGYIVNRETPAFTAPNEEELKKEIEARIVKHWGHMESFRRDAYWQYELGFRECHQWLTQNDPKETPPKWSEREDRLLETLAMIAFNEAPVENTGLVSKNLALDCLAKVAPNWTMDEMLERRLCNTGEVHTAKFNDHGLLSSIRDQASQPDEEFIAHAIEVSKAAYLTDQKPKRTVFAGTSYVIATDRTAESLNQIEECGMGSIDEDQAKNLVRTLTAERDELKAKIEVLQSRASQFESTLTATMEAEKKWREWAMTAREAFKYYDGDELFSENYAAELLESFPGGDDET